MRKRTKWGRNLMDAYTAFAQVYDLFMDNVPYEPWCAYITGILREHDITEGPILDLGCGTGELTRLLAAEGYDLTGVDSSPEMLQEALAGQRGQDILYLLQPMQELELDGCVRAVCSACDCINYLLDEGELLETFRRVQACLEEDGIFLFDVNTDYKYRQLLGDNTFAESRDEGAFIWENYYDEESAVNEYDLTLFIPDREGLFRRYTETHLQRNYPLSLLTELLREAGFTRVELFDDYTREPVRRDSERVTLLAQKG